MPVLTHLFALLAMIFIVGGTCPTKAETNENRPEHIIIALDNSGSMDDLPERHIDLVRNGLIDALQAYTENCETVTVSFIAWGNVYPVVRQASLNDRESRFHLIEEIVTLSERMQSQTIHTAGYNAAEKLVRTDEETVLIFITDAIGTTPIEKTPSFVVHKVALGGPPLVKWLEHSFLPHHGTIHQPRDSAAIAALLTEILDHTKHEVCVG